VVCLGKQGRTADIGPGKCRVRLRELRHRAEREGRPPRAALRSASAAVQMGPLHPCTGPPAHFPRRRARPAGVVTHREPKGWPSARGYS
jgi:hypothetical protein